MITHNLQFVIGTEIAFCLPYEGKEIFEWLVIFYFTELYDDVMVLFSVRMAGRANYSWRSNGILRSLVSGLLKSALVLGYLATYMFLNFQETENFNGFICEILCCTYSELITEYNFVFTEIFERLLCLWFCA